MNRSKGNIPWRLSMLQNYFRVAFRVLVKQRLFTSINVIGLSVGVAFCLLLALYVKDEVTFDHHHTNADRIGRVISDSKYADGSIKSRSPWLPYPLGKALETDHSGIEHTVRMNQGHTDFTAGAVYTEGDLLFADPAVLSVFSIPLLEGDPSTALPEPDGLVISSEMANLLFPGESAMGQTIEISQGKWMRVVSVTGVAAPQPANSSVKFDFLMTFEHSIAQLPWRDQIIDDWGTSNYFVYFMLHEGVTFESAGDLMPSLRARYYPQSVTELTDAGLPIESYTLQPLKSIHMDTSVQGGLVDTSNPLYSWLLAGLALLVLLIASINYTTLSIGQAGARVKEIGLRKVIGARRSEILRQLGWESLLMGLLISVIGGFLAVLLLPVFSDLSGKQLQFNLFQDGTTVGLLVVLVLCVSIFSNIFPALRLSGLPPVDVLRGRSRLGGSRKLVSSLVTLQFVISITLISGMHVMSRQMNLFSSTPVGYQKDRTMVVPLWEVNQRKAVERFRSELADKTQIEGVTAISNAFTQGYSSYSLEVNGVSKQVYRYGVESDFLDVMKIELEQGRNFLPGSATDSSSSVIVNQAFVQALDIENPVGHQLTNVYGSPTIIGVVKDFNYRSLRHKVEPTVLSLEPKSTLNYALIQYAPGKSAETIQLAATVWKSLAPESPFDYSFLDQDLESMYLSEAKWTKIISFSALFANLIACLGLFGMAAMSAAIRKSEIGIRRVLGASVTGIIFTLSRDLIKFVLLAAVFSIPLTSWALSRWLDDFAYRVDVDVMTFFFSIGLALGIALATTLYQSVKSATANPVESIRS